MEPIFSTKNIINAIEKARKVLRHSAYRTTSIDFYKNGKIAINSKVSKGFLFTYALPNWDNEVFKEISGIDVEKELGIND